MLYKIDIKVKKTYKIDLNTHFFDVFICFLNKLYDFCYDL